MKWKLTSRYVFSMVLVVFFILLINILLVTASFVARLSYNVSFFEENAFDPEEFTRAFANELHVDEGKIELSTKGQDALVKQNAWLQVLDEDGAELFSYRTPAEIQKKYTPIELIQMYKYKEFGHTTVYVGDTKEEHMTYSYLLGIENKNLNRYFISYDNQDLKNIAKMAGFILFVDALIAIFIGYLFSKYLTKPMLVLISNVQQLANKNYMLQSSTGGVYGEVFDSVYMLSEQLQESQREREKLEELRREWIGNISHDIKTPLASIQGYAELIKEPDYDFSIEEMREYAEIIEQKSLYIEDVMNDLNMSTRLQNNMLQLQLKEVNLVSFLRGLVIDTLNDPKNQERAFHFHAEEEEILYAVDETLLKRALSNLINNALFHNQENVQLDISIQKTDEIEIQINDNGRGIKKEDLERIFDRYYRGTNTGDQHKGSGLGMVIAKDIIEAHQGQIKINSPVNRGTNIRIEFPLLSVEKKLT